ncbi:MULTISPECIES: protoporphyrinogen oxidase [unclassified Arthrobacter]|uniref:protoporphyrinogen oxidase n=1 Tax=unclassified Arthrobacter TaxID=235627 RepID=UPI001491C870|nr:MULTISPECIES: protoporphyrinogen oxidase [unclassified Arthrobacter]MBE0008738.1 protoporphyrinogen oxidase [Arthrobacter sp. AET 35A]NOJ62571.1 protoporphyrinogen oxidase [Arthrobacter sp. 147(2020)]
MPHRTTVSRQAAAKTVVVIGGGMAGLIAARELVGRGLDVTVLERSAGFGGCVADHEVAGLRLDSGAESYSTRSETVPALARELGLGDLLVTPNPVGAWIRFPGKDPQHSAMPLPRSGILGIPADVLDPDIVKAIGRAGALRASLDRVLPLGSLYKDDGVSLGEVVRARMGVDVLDRLVAPVVGGVFSADPDDLDVDSVAPGLRKMMKKHGSLGAAVGAMRAAAPAGSAVGGLSGGMAQLTRVLTIELRAAGVHLQPGNEVRSIARAGTGWTITTSASTGTEPTGTESTMTADAVVMAVDGPGAVDLLGEALPRLVTDRPRAVPGVALVTLVVDVPELDAHPRGTGVLVAAGAEGVSAKALTHATAKWQWLADQAGPGSHVLRLSYGRAGQVGEELADDDSLYRQALADASTLLETPIADDDVVGWKVVRWNGALPHASVGHRDLVARVRAAAAAERTLEITGAWLAGTGLVAVIDDARVRAKALADRLT